MFAQFAKDFASFGAVVEAVNHLDAEKLPPPLLRQLASLLPTEAEVLYPPLTYLRATGKTETLARALDGRDVRVVEVTCVFGSS